MSRVLQGVVKMAYLYVDNNYLTLTTHYIREPVCVIHTFPVIK